MSRFASCKINKDPIASAGRAGKRCLTKAILNASLIVLIAAPCVFAQNPAASGDASGRLALDRLGTVQGLQGFTNPLIGGNAPMTTLDGSQSFTSQLSCPSSTQFLNLLAVPSATGDLSQVIIGQDTDGESNPLEAAMSWIVTMPR